MLLDPKYRLLFDGVSSSEQSSIVGFLCLRDDDCTRTLPSENVGLVGDERGVKNICVSGEQIGVRGVRGVRGVNGVAGVDGLCGERISVRGV